MNYSFFGNPTRYPPLKNTHRPALQLYFLSVDYAFPHFRSSWPVFGLRGNSILGFCCNVSSRAANWFFVLSTVLVFLTLVFAPVAVLSVFTLLFRRNFVVFIGWLWVDMNFTLTQRWTDTEFCSELSTHNWHIVKTSPMVFFGDLFCQSANSPSAMFCKAVFSIVE